MQFNSLKLMLGSNCPTGNDSVNTVQLSLGVCQIVQACDILCDLRTQSIGTMTMCVVEPLIVCEPLYVTCV